MTSSTRRGILLASALLLTLPTPSLLLAAPAAEAGPRRTFDVPAGPAATTFKQFIAQSQVQLLFVADEIAGIQTPAIRGSYTPREAIDRLLRDTPLSAVQTANGSIAVKRAAAPNAPGPAPSPATAAARPSVQPAADDTPVTLTPFEVSTTKDYGYTATATLSGGRLATNLRDTPAAVSVLNRDFLTDIGSVDTQEAMRWTANAFAATGNDVTTEAGAGTARSGVQLGVSNNSNVRIRGIRDTTAARNFFLWNINSDSFSTERIDISRGPNALVFGDGSSGGIVNITTKRAARQPFAEVALQTSNYGGLRATLDVNRPLSRNLAVRVALLAQDSDGWRDFSTNRKLGAFATVTWDLARHTQLRAEVEYGRTESNQPVAYLRDGTSRWNGTFTVAAPLAAGASFPAAAGVSTLVNRPTLDLGRIEAGFNNWSRLARTNGPENPIELRIPGGVTGVSTAALVTQNAVPGAGRTFPIVPDYAFATQAASRFLDQELHNVSLFLTHSIGRNLHLEFGANYQWQETQVYQPLSNNRVHYDINAVLPAGMTINGSNANPNFLKPFVEDGIRANDNRYLGYEARAGAVYTLDTSLTKQRLGLMTSWRLTDRLNLFPRIVPINSTTADLSAPINQIGFRTYLDQRHLGSQVYRIGPTYTVGGVQMKYVNFNGSGPFLDGDTTLKSAQVFASGSWFKDDRLHTIFGVRRDWVRSVSYGTSIYDPVTRVLVRNDRSADVKSAVDSPSFGGVLHVTDWLSVFANGSNSFVPATSGAQSISGAALPERKGTGVDAGVKLSLWSGRLSGSLGYFKVQEKNNSFTTSVLANAYTRLSGFTGSNVVYVSQNDTQTAEAKGWEADFTANLTPEWSLLFNVGVPESTLQDALPYSRAIFAQNRSAWEAIANGTGPNAAAARTDLANIAATFASFEDGRAVPNVRDYTANIFSRYRFARGPLKGFLFGGGANIFGQNYLGVRGALTDNSPSFYTVSALLGYERKIGDIRWSLRLNVNNVLDQWKLRYTTINADGTPQNYRLESPREFRLSLAAKF